MAMNRRDFMAYTGKAFLLPLLFSGSNLYSEEVKTSDVNAAKKHICLTIDDGPGKYMEHILEVLGDNKVIFYTIGSQLENERGFDLAKRAVQIGHVIGNHSYGHPNFMKIPFDKCKMEISRTDAIIEEVYKSAGVQRKLKLFRFPYGATNKSIVPYLSNNGYQPIKRWDEYDDWDIDSLDWKIKSAGIVMKRCKKAQDGNIVLMHDMPRGIKSTAFEVIPFYINSGMFETFIPDKIAFFKFFFQFLLM